MTHKHRPLGSWGDVWAGETEPSVLIKFLGSALHTGRDVPSQFHVPVVPVCFGDHPKVLENSVSASQIIWDGDLQAGKGPFYPFGLPMEKCPGPRKICET